MQEVRHEHARGLASVIGFSISEICYCDLEIIVPMPVS